MDERPNKTRESARSQRAGWIERIRRVALGAAGAALLAACEPVFIFAGGELGGVERAHPENWEFAAAVDTVQIETRPDDPYSVNVWGVGVGQNFYVAASDAADARWAQAIETNGNVRLKVAAHVYPLAAERVDSADELALVAAAYVAKYEVDPDESFIDSAWVYRLARR